jgi:hypothetical protein
VHSTTICEVQHKSIKLKVKHKCNFKLFNILARTFVEQYCIQDKINENCEFLKCANGQFTTMPSCPPGLSYGKTHGNFGCLLAGHPDTCIPQHGFVTTISEFYTF